MFSRDCGCLFHCLYLQTLMSYMASLFYYKHFTHRRFHAIPGLHCRKPQWRGQYSLSKTQVKSNRLGKAYLGLVIKSHCLCQQKRHAIVFISNWYLQAQLSILSQYTLLWECVLVVHEWNTYKGSFGYLRMQLCSFSYSAHQRKRESQWDSRHRRVSGVRISPVWAHVPEGRGMGDMSPLLPRVPILCFVGNVR